MPKNNEAGEEGMDGDSQKMSPELAVCGLRNVQQNCPAKGPASPTPFRRITGLKQAHGKTTLEREPMTVQYHWEASRTQENIPAWQPKRKEKLH